MEILKKLFNTKNDAKSDDIVTSVPLKTETLVKILGVAGMTNRKPEDLVLQMIEEKTAEYCREDGSFAPKKGWYNHCVNGQDVRDECIVLSPIKIGYFDCYTIYYKGKITHKFQLEIDIDE